MWLGTDLYSGNFGKEYTYKDFKSIIDYCADIGLEKIDTAECYGINPPVEEMLGTALAGKRDKFIIALLHCPLRIKIIIGPFLHINRLLKIPNQRNKFRKAI